MKQVIYSGYFELVQAFPSPRYAPLDGEAWLHNEVSGRSIISTPGTIRKLRIKLVDLGGVPRPPGVGTHYTFTMRKNYANTPIVITISDLETEGSDLVHEITVAPGDVISLEGAWSPGAVNAHARWVSEFQGNNDRESVIFGGNTQLVFYLNRFASYADLHNRALEAEVEQIIAVDGVIKNLYVSLASAADPGGADGFIFTLRRNGAPTLLTCTITNGDTEGSDTLHEVPVSAGDRVCFHQERTPTGNPPGNVMAYYGTTFEANTFGESPLPNGCFHPLNAGAIRYSYLTWLMTGGVVNEWESQQLALAATLRSLFVEVSVAPGVGKSWTFTVRRNGADTPLAVTIAGANTSGNNLVNTVVVADGDYVDLKCEPAGAPAAAYARWGLLSDLPAALPTATTDPATLISQVSATQNGLLNDDGGEACQCGFEWGETIAYEHGATPTQGKTTGQSFSQVIIGLDPNTTYHFRAFATNAAGTGYGVDRTFTTEALPPAVIIPTVTTDPATLISQVSATLNGLLNDDGGEACQCGFEWGLTPAYGHTTLTGSKVTGESFSQAIGSLTPGTTYHFRAFATNSAGTGYGADMSFTTTPTFSRAHALSREEL